jgi:hypothetical protein
MIDPKMGGGVDDCGTLSRSVTVNGVKLLFNSLEEYIEGFPNPSWHQYPKGLC